MNHARSLRSALLLAGILALSGSLRAQETGGTLLLSPNAKTVCYEGEECEIRWVTEERGKLCIEAAVGGHDKGILNDCATPARRGRWLWRVPRGFVSGFGPTISREVRIALYPAEREGERVVSPPFTIRALRDSEPPRRRKK
jgi:hypothetical protein